MDAMTRHMFAMGLPILCFDFLLSLAQHFHKFRFHVILFINRLCHTIAMRGEAELLFEYTLIIIAPINRSLGNYMFEANQWYRLCRWLREIVLSFTAYLFKYWCIYPRRFFCFSNHPKYHFFIAPRVYPISLP